MAMRSPGICEDGPIVAKTHHTAIHGREYEGKASLRKHAVVMEFTAIIHTHIQASFDVMTLTRMMSHAEVQP